MTKQLKPVKQISGRIRVPGDKSIAHRAALLSILATGPIVVKNFPSNEDCSRSLEAAKTLGVTIEESNGTLTLFPPTTEHANSPDTLIDCGNSGTTVRLLAGIIAGSNRSAMLTGDASLSTRPMKRIVKPLTEMGAELIDTDGHLPLTVRGSKLMPFEYRLPVPSAQVKSAILLAGQSSSSTVLIRENIITRNHTELMLSALGAKIEIRPVKSVLVEDPHDPRKRRSVMPEDFVNEIQLHRGNGTLSGEIDIPGDISTAAFFFAAAAVTGGQVTVEAVGLNPTRVAYLQHLKAIGCRVEISDRETMNGELRGNVTVTGGSLRARKISGEHTAALIDELPLVAVMAIFAEGTTVIRNAAELRMKESDRLEALAENLRRMNVKVGLLEDGLAIEGRSEPSGADFASFGDHRIAMAFSIAALAASGPSTLDNPDITGVSCPRFFELLAEVSAT